MQAQKTSFFPIESPTGCKYACGFFTNFTSSKLRDVMVVDILENHIHQIMSFMSPSTNSHYGERFLQWSPDPTRHQPVTKHPVHSGNLMRTYSHLIESLAVFFPVQDESEKVKHKTCITTHPSTRAQNFPCTQQLYH